MTRNMPRITGEVARKVREAAVKEKTFDGVKNLSPDA
jgi:hypothetical protein